MKLTKTESFVHKNREQRISLQVKFSLCSEISLCRENSLCSEIAIVSENFAIVEKFRYYREIPYLPLLVPTCSSINFFISGLIQSKINHTNSM